MRVNVDMDKCTGHARCWSVAPEIFTIDDEGYSDIGTSREVRPGSEDLARRGVAACPEHALTLEDP